MARTLLERLLIRQPVRLSSQLRRCMKPAGALAAKPWRGQDKEWGALPTLVAAQCSLRRRRSTRSGDLHLIFIEELCGKDPAKIKTRGKCNHCGWKIGPTVKVNASKTVICNMLQHCCHPVAGMLVRGIPGT